MASVLFDGGRNHGRNCRLTGTTDPTIPLPPPTAREDVADVVHGDRIADPYRWLEDADAPRTRAWTEAQNARTAAVLDGLPETAVFRERLRELFVGALEAPRLAGGRLFHVRREGAQPQGVLYVRDSVDRSDRALVDPNALDVAGLVVLDWWYPSRDGALVAYGLSRGGDEMSTLHVIEVAGGSALPERIPHTQRAAVAWVPGGFYYTVSPAPGSVPAGDEHYHRRVRFHRLGTPHETDEVVFGEGRPKEDIVNVSTSPDGRWALFSAWHGWRRNDVYLLDRRTPGATLRPVAVGLDALTYGSVQADGALWLTTNHEAPNGRVVTVDPRDADLGPSAWREVIPEGDNALVQVAHTSSHLVVQHLVGATSRLSIWSRDGSREREVELGEHSTVSGPIGADDGELATFSVESFVRPPVAYAIDVDTGALTEVVRLSSPPRHDPDAYAVEQVRYASKDGTSVTMFLIRRRDVAPSGQVPTILTGYGGFNLSRTPVYTPSALAWVERGGLYAIPNLRGGGEYGEGWHRGGMLDRKQNVFDDFLAAAEHLIASGWTRPERLAISGGSNGGLLVGAAMTQRPELFAGVLCGAPLLDMLRYQRLLIARFWIAEYGSAEDPAQYKWLRAYSPYHNVRPNEHYPPILLTSAEGDSRVDPMHARKMTALLQAHDPEALVLLRVDRDAGHGIGRPLAKLVQDYAYGAAFCAWRTGLKVERR